MAQPSVQTSERARRALSNFRKMQYSLTSFARALAGNNKITIEISSTGGYTDGQKIYYRPPLSLGDQLKHDRNNCDKRSDNKILICPACASREEVLVTIYHELGHIVFDSFQTVKDSDLRKAIEYTVRDINDPVRGKVLTDNIEELSGTDRFNYLELARAVNPYLQFLLNCIEDARIDSAMFRARRGVKNMKSAQLYSVLKDGIESNDGEMHHWRDSPLNGQAAIACYFEAIDLIDWREYLHDSVVEAFLDARLVELLADVPDLKDAAQSYEATISVLEILREYGFFQTEEDENADSGSEEEESNDTDKERGDGQTGEPSGSEDGVSDSDAVPEEGSGAGLPSDQSVSEQHDAKSDDTEAEGQCDGSEDRENQSDNEGMPKADSHDDSQHERPERNEALDGMAESEGASSDADQLDRNPQSESPTPSGDTESAGREEVDTGADEGRGGVSADINDNTPDHGVPEDLVVIEKLFHNDEVEVVTSEDMKALEVAIIQGLYFEKPSKNVHGVRIHKYPNTENDAWGNETLTILGRAYETGVGKPGDFNVAESIIAPALLLCRRIFSDNAIAAHQHNRRSGRIHRKVLGRRAWSDDDRLFTKKRLPGKRSYAVLIGIDISGSTFGVNLILAKKAAWAQAELCHRMGIDFALYAHTANSDPDFSLDVYEIKTFDEVWDRKTRIRLDEIGPDSDNLDGHGLEFYRKRLDEVNATDKILLYYTDGKMPAANYKEELDILQREIKTCNKKGYHLLGVGIRTDSPKKHGLDTVQIDDETQLKAVVNHLEKRLIA